MPPKSQLANKNKAEAEEERRFRSAYSKALAEALLANEEQQQEQRQGELSSKELKNNGIKDAYISLCYDDPIISNGGDEVCFSLAQAIISSSFSSCATAAASSGSTRLDSKDNHDNDNEKEEEEEECHYALSERLVNGILQATSRFQKSHCITNTNKTKTQQEERGDELNSSRDKNYDNNDISSTMISKTNNIVGSSSSSPTPNGYAQLAFAIFALGPLYCCRSTTDINAIRKFLGTYSGGSSSSDGEGRVECTTEQCTTSPPPRHHDDRNYNDTMGYGDKEQRSTRKTNYNDEDEEKTRMKTDEEEEETKKMLFDNRGSLNDGKNIDYNKTNDSDDTENYYDNNNNDSNEHDSLKEIFAEESDPDDFEYESFFDYNNNNNNNNNNHQQQHLKESTTALSFQGFDPKVLSTPQNNLSWEDMRYRVYSLLQELTYDKLVPLTSNGWNDSTYGYNVSKTLKELTLLLLYGGESYATSCGSEKKETLLNPCTIFKEKKKDSVYAKQLRKEWRKPLHILRNRALVEASSSSSFDRRRHRNHDDDDDVLDEYLDILQTLLHEESTSLIPENISTTTKGRVVSTGEEGEEENNDHDSMQNTIKYMALTSLSALCISNEILHSRSKKVQSSIRNCIMNNLDYLMDIIESVRPKVIKPTTARRRTTTTASQNSKSPLKQIEDKNHINNDNNNMQSSVSQTPQAIDTSRQQQSALPSWVHVTIAILPMLDFLTNVRGRFDFSPLTTLRSSTGSKSSNATITTTATNVSSAVSAGGGRTGEEGGGVALSFSSSLSNGEAQSLLNSGLFRELLLLYTTTDQTCCSSTTFSSSPPSSSTSSSSLVLLPKSQPSCGTTTTDDDDDDEAAIIPTTATARTITAQDIIRTQLARTLWVLCAQSPAVLCKYAMRVSEFASLVHTKHYLKEHIVDGILWSILYVAGGYHTADSGSRWKVTKNITAATTTISSMRGGKDEVLSRKELQHWCLDGFVVLCDAVTRSLGKISRGGQQQRRRRPRGGGGTGDEDGNSIQQTQDGSKRTGGTDDDDDDDSLTEFVRFANCMHYCPTVATSWLSCMAEIDETLRKAKGSISDVRTALTNIPSVSGTLFDDKNVDEFSVGNETKVKQKCEFVEDDDKDKKNHSKKKELDTRGLEETLAAVRRGTKVISLLLESHDLPGGIRRAHVLKGKVMSSKID